ncbi:UNKNOWN [Stylonychia lemnae]|uniref:Transmembrane protein n=1 Tax=Stylonychia lemnae TaxID=5949 RepID=A0A078BAB1_STYLE|nr:UNKNOWN [Stylonychia lemnae]|eukprot:CDW91485.1 UNKNOWN [Stylonychia lemnae]
MMVKDFQLNWPQQVLTFLEYFSAGGQGFSKIVSFECFLKNTGIEATIKHAYLFVLLNGIFPIALSGIAWFVWNAARAFKFMDKSNYFSNFKTSIILFAYLCYPIITQNSFSLFSCVSLDDGNQYLRSDMSIQCWSNEHYKFSTAIAIPFIFLWSLCFPIFISLQLLRYKNNLSDEKIIKQYGLFYSGLQDKNFYWELTYVNGKKLLFISFSSALAGIFILFVEIQMSYNRNPYIDPQMNNIDRYSIYASISILIGGVIFIDSDTDLSENFQVTIFALILATNILFMMRWMFSFFRILIFNNLGLFQRRFGLFKSLKANNQDGNQIKNQDDKLNRQQIQVQNYQARIYQSFRNQSRNDNQGKQYKKIPNLSILTTRELLQIEMNQTYEKRQK